MLRKLAMLWKDEDGPTAVEYALMIVLVALVIAAATPGIRAAVQGVFTDTATQLNVRP